MPLILSLFAHEEMNVSSELLGTINSFVNELKRQASSRTPRSYSLNMYETVDQIFAIIVQRIR